MTAAEGVWSGGTGLIKGTGNTIASTVRGGVNWVGETTLLLGQHAAATPGEIWNTTSAVVGGVSRTAAATPGMISSALSRGANLAQSTAVGTGKVIASPFIGLYLGAKGASVSVYQGSKALFDAISLSYQVTLDRSAISKQLKAMPSNELIAVAKGETILTHLTELDEADSIWASERRAALGEMISRITAGQEVNSLLNAIEEIALHPNFNIPIQLELREWLVGYYAEQWQASNYEVEGNEAFTQLLNLVQGKDRAGLLSSALNTTISSSDGSSYDMKSSARAVLMQEGGIHTDAVLKYLTSIDRLLREGIIQNCDTPHLLKLLSDARIHSAADGSLIMQIERSMIDRLIKPDSRHDKSEARVVILRESLQLPGLNDSDRIWLLNTIVKSTPGNSERALRLLSEIAAGDRTTIGTVFLQAMRTQKNSKLPNIDTVDALYRLIHNMRDIVYKTKPKDMIKAMRPKYEACRQILDRLELPRYARLEIIRALLWALNPSYLPEKERSLYIRYLVDQFRPIATEFDDTASEGLEKQSICGVVNHGLIALQSVMTSSELMDALLEGTSIFSDPALMEYLSRSQKESLFEQIEDSVLQNLRAGQYTLEQLDNFATNPKLMERIRDDAGARLVAMVNATLKRAVSLSSLVGPDSLGLAA